MNATPQNQPTEHSGSDAPNCSAFEIPQGFRDEARRVIRCPRWLAAVLREEADKNDAWAADYDGCCAAWIVAGKNRLKRDVYLDTASMLRAAADVFDPPNAGGMAWELAAQKPESTTDDNG